jgi:hypothetical protein
MSSIQLDDRDFSEEESFSEMSSEGHEKSNLDLFEELMYMDEDEDDDDRYDESVGGDAFDAWGRKIDPSKRDMLKDEDDDWMSYKSVREIEAKQPYKHQSSALASLRAIPLAMSPDMAS